MNQISGQMNIVNFNKLINMYHLPMHLSPEEKLSVFWHKYEELKRPTSDPIIKMESETSKEVPSNNTPIINISFPEEFTPEEKETYQQVLEEDVEVPVVNEDVPDVSTMTSRFFRTTQKINPSSIVDEIKSLTAITDSDKKYLALLQQLESGGNPKVVNRYGYMGLYQFGLPALKTVGMSKEDYMANTINQHIAALRLLGKNSQQLNKYIGRTIKGIPLTRYNLGAAQHLVGAGAVKEFIESDGKVVKQDGNNVPLTAYLIRFSQIQ